MVRVSTDLPAPEGPTKPRISPRFTSRLSPSRIARLAELHGDVANPDDGVGGRLQRHAHIPIAAKKIANTPSMTMTKKMRLHDGRRGVLAERLGRALHREALDAGDDADHSRHDRRLDQADDEMIDRDGVAQAQQKRFRIDAAIEPGDEPAAIERGHRAEEGEDRQRHHQRQHARQRSGPRSGRSPWCAARRSPRASSSSRVRRCRRCRSGRRP